MGGFGSDEGMQRQGDMWDRIWDSAFGDRQDNVGGVEGLLDIGWPARGSIPTRAMTVGSTHFTDTVPYPLSADKKTPDGQRVLGMDWRSAALDSAARAHPLLNSFYRIEIEPGGEKKAQAEAQRLITDGKYGREFGQLPPEFLPNEMIRDMHGIDVPVSRFQWYVERQEGMSDAQFRAAQDAQLANLKVIEVPDPAQPGV